MSSSRNYGLSIQYRVYQWQYARANAATCRNRCNICHLLDELQLSLLARHFVPVCQILWFCRWVLSWFHRPSAKVVGEHDWAMPLDACTPSSDGTGCRVVGVVYTGTRLYSKRIRPFFKFLDLCNKWEFNFNKSVEWTLSCPVQCETCFLRRFALCSSVLLWALPFCSGLFRFALGSSVLLWALPFCSGLFLFALGSSVCSGLFLFALGSSSLLWALPLCSGLFLFALSLLISVALSVALLMCSSVVYKLVAIDWSQCIIKAIMFFGYTICGDLSNT